MRKRYLVPLLLFCAVPVAAATWTDSFDYPAESAGEPDWRAESVNWSAGAGRMRSLTPGGSYLYLDRLGHGRTVKVSATLQIDDFLDESWCVAGLTVHHAPGWFWRCGLVRSPVVEGQEPRRFCELGVALDGRWPATGTASVEQTADVGRDWSWETGHPYRLTLELTADGVSSTFAELDGTVRRRLAYRFTGDEVVRDGQVALYSGGYRSWFDDLKATVGDPVRAPEVVTPAADYPPYDLSGDPTIEGEQTGFFHTSFQDGKWWLIDPNGQGFLSVGTQSVRYTGAFSVIAGYSPYARTTAEKYGSETAWAEAQVERLSDWGFNTISGAPASLEHTKFVDVKTLSYALRAFEVAHPLILKEHWSSVPDVFHPRWEWFCDTMAKRLCSSRRNDPWLLGWYLTNEIPWGPEGALLNASWSQAADRPAKQAMVRLAREQFGAIAKFNQAYRTKFGSWDELAASEKPVTGTSEAAIAFSDAFGLLIGERYYRILAEAIRKHDPNHMVLGTRIHNAPRAIWAMCGKYCDVVTTNIYPRIDVDRGVPQSVVDEITRRFTESGGQTPLIFTEWSFPALDSGLPNKGGAGMRVATQAQKAACYRAFQSTLFSLPFVVGSHYFKFNDQPAEGVAPWFPEDSNYGLVNDDDEPYETLVETATEVNPTAYRLHHEGRLSYAFTPQARHWTGQVGERIDPPATLSAGNLKLDLTELAPGVKLSYRGRELGSFLPLAHLQGSTTGYLRPETGRVEQVWADERCSVTDLVFERRAEELSYRAGYRLWVPKSGADWCAVQWRWFENTSTGAYTLLQLFDYALPNLGGDPAGDEADPMTVPNYYQPFGAFYDAAEKLGFAATTLDPNLSVHWWYDSSFHADTKQRLGLPLAAGGKWSQDGPLAILFGYDGERPLSQRLEAVRAEVAKWYE